MSDFQFRVIDPIRQRRVASDPRESFRFLESVKQIPALPEHLQANTWGQDQLPTIFEPSPDDSSSSNETAVKRV